MFNPEVGGSEVTCTTLRHISETSSVNGLQAGRLPLAQCELTSLPLVSNGVSRRASESAPDVVSYYSLVSLLSVYGDSVWGRCENRIHRQPCETQTDAVTSVDKCKKTVCVGIKRHVAQDVLVSFFKCQRLGHAVAQWLRHYATSGFET
jgi:hypothetical protein